MAISELPQEGTRFTVAAPATVNSESAAPAPLDFREGRGGRRPVSQETCRRTLVASANIGRGVPMP